MECSVVTCLSPESSRVSTPTPCTMVVETGYRSQLADSDPCDTVTADSCDAHQSPEEVDQSDCYGLPYQEILSLSLEPLRHDNFESPAQADEDCPSCSRYWIVWSSWNVRLPQVVFVWSSGFALLLSGFALDWVALEHDHVLKILLHICFRYCWNSFIVFPLSQNCFSGLCSKFKNAHIVSRSADLSARSCFSYSHNTLSLGN